MRFELQCLNWLQAAPTFGVASSCLPQMPEAFTEEIHIQTCSNAANSIYRHQSPEPRNAKIKAQNSRKKTPRHKTGETTTMLYA